ncbi:MAG TPA: nucleotidyltransferase domain-containing protein [Halothiobacillus sp.]|nr:nucleotidyltransferase domain-containing protein [Halothiobacillus sp.]
MSLNAILFPEYRRRVLGLLLLHPDQRYYLREIARLTGTTAGTLARELTKLVKAGVITVQKVGNQSHYSANPDCPVFDELASILRKTSGLTDVLADALLPLADQIEVAFIFGSVASGKARSESDIDLMVIGDVSFKAVVTALYSLQERLGRELNPKVYSRMEWRNLVAENGTFIRDIQKKPMLFIMGRESDLHDKEVAPS